MDLIRYNILSTLTTLKRFSMSSFGKRSSNQNRHTNTDKTSSLGKRPTTATQETYEVQQSRFWLMLLIVLAATHRFFTRKSDSKNLS